MSAVTDADAAANTLPENASLGQPGGYPALASDADATTNAMTYTLDDDAGGRFAIDAASGVVTLAGALDFETSVEPCDHRARDQRGRQLQPPRFSR